MTSYQLDSAHERKQSHTLPLPPLLLSIRFKQQNPMGMGLVRLVPTKPIRQKGIKSQGEIITHYVIAPSYWQWAYLVFPHFYFLSYQ